MPKEIYKKQLCVDDIRHSEYYDLQSTFDELYAKSANGGIFTNIMDLILSRENILLAYRNIKANKGSCTPGTDNLTIESIGVLTPEKVIQQVRFIVSGSCHGYRPRPVRRKDIPKPNGSTRPLGIPCIWDRLIQQCIKQVMEPICEAKFSNNSYGFRPNRSVEHAVAATYRMMQLTKLHFVIEFDIKGFFDNVNHAKLMRQIWAMGIHDKHLIYVIRKILTAPIKMPDGINVYPTKGTPQGGIISPLLANIVLNELDHWIESQWSNNPVIEKRKAKIYPNGRIDRSNGYKIMHQTKLKEMYIVRYADDFRIFCRCRQDAERIKAAVAQWLQQRLKLEVSDEKTRIVNVKKKYSEFLGFKIRVHKKKNRYVVMSHMCDKAFQKQRQKLVNQAKNIAKPRDYYREEGEIRVYNSMVMGLHNYYRIATNINVDCSRLNRAVMIVLTNRLRTQSCNRLRKTGRPLTKTEQQLFGKSKMLRYVAGSDEPIYPIGYIRCKNPMGKKRSINKYTPEGRIDIHDNLQINKRLLCDLMRQPLFGRSAEYADNRLSLFSAQWGKCGVTGRTFESAGDIHCHHITPRSKGGSDKYSNLVLVLKPVHKLIHASAPETIAYYLKLLNLDKSQVRKINHLREEAGLLPLTT